MPNYLGISHASERPLDRFVQRINRDHFAGPHDVRAITAGDDHIVLQQNLRQREGALLAAAATVGAKAG